MREIMITSSLLIIALVILRRLWWNKISRRLQYSLWLLVVLRLLVPVTMIDNPFYVMNVLQSVADKAEEENLPGGSPAGKGRVVYSANSTDEGEKAGQNASTQTGSEFFHAIEHGEDILTGNREVQDRQEASGDREIQGNRTNSESQASLKNQEMPENRETVKDQEMQGSREKTAALEVYTEKSENRLSLKEQERILESRKGLSGFFAGSPWRGVWCAGAAVISLWMAVCNLIFRFKICKERTALGRERGRMVYLVEGLGTPCLLGIFRPAIYLTRDSVENPRHKEHAIIHELTHYRHGDHIWAFVRSLCLVIYWFDPFVWLAVHLSARDCEMACDEGVTSRLGEDHSREYGNTLIEMAVSGKKGPGLLGCATGFSSRKRELKERLSRIGAGRKRTGIFVMMLVAVCGILLALGTFGSVRKETGTGRYVETGMTLSGLNGGYWGLAQDGKDIRLVANVNLDMMLDDAGAEFKAVGLKEMPPGTTTLDKRNPWYVTGSTSGARVLSKAYYLEGDYVAKNSLITDSGEEIRLEALGNNLASTFYSHGWFYLYKQIGTGVWYYKLDPGTGEMQFLTRSFQEAYFLTSDEQLLYLVEEGGVQLFDLEKEEMAERDQVLSEFVAGKYTESQEIPVMLCPYQDGVYILTHQGMYWHKLYGETVEMVIDGGFCSMGDISRSFTGIALRETENEPEFFVLYDGGEMMRYTYDPELVPHALRIYSVYGDDQVSKAVEAFRKQYPDVPVVYEVGMDTACTGTADDALKALAEAIAAGNGPDILVMDDIPFDTYVEQGILADLSDLREGMTEEAYFVNVIDGFARDEKLYAVPMTFAVPVLVGKQELVEGAESLSDLADLLEAQRADSKADYVFCTWDAESTLRLLAQSSQGAWMQDGTLNREAVTEFLIQAKRIYDIQFSVKEEPAVYNREILAHDNINPGLWIGDYRHYPLARYFDSDGIFCMMDQAKWSLENASCYAGFMSGSERDYLYIQGIQKAHGETYVRMPGQQYGTCLASSLLAVNADTDYAEESRQFLEYAVSAGFLSEGEMNGTPVSREAYRLKQRPKAFYRYLGGYTDSRKKFAYEIDWPKAQDYEMLDSLLDGVTGVNSCDSVVYETVVEYGRAALMGELEISVAVDAIEKQVKSYLTE